RLTAGKCYQRHAPIRLRFGEHLRHYTRWKEARLAVLIANAVGAAEVAQVGQLEDQLDSLPFSVSWRRTGARCWHLWSRQGKGWNRQYQRWRAARSRTGGPLRDHVRRGGGKRGTVSPAPPGPARGALPSPDPAPARRSAPPAGRERPASGAGGGGCGFPGRSPGREARAE